MQRGCWQFFPRLNIKYRETENLHIISRSSDANKAWPGTSVRRMCSELVCLKFGVWSWAAPFDRPDRLVESPSPITRRRFRNDSFGSRASWLKHNGGEQAFRGCGATELSGLGTDGVTERDLSRSFFSGSGAHMFGKDWHVVYAGVDVPDGNIKSITSIGGLTGSSTDCCTNSCDSIAGTSNWDNSWSTQLSRSC